MSTDMSGIHQKSLFDTLATIIVFVAPENRYRVLNDVLPWGELADVANKYRSMKVDINNGRPLNLKLHLGAYIAQSMNGWTDRETEDMVRHHAGVRILCGIDGSSESIDHTSITDFRNTLGKDGAEELNRIIVLHAAKQGFTGSGLCSADTTVQEAPIAYPTEVGHLKNIVEKLLGIGKKLKKGISGTLVALKDQAMDIFTEIRLFTRGKKEKAIEKKKEQGKKLLKNTKKMYRIVEEAWRGMGKYAQEKYREELEYYRKMLEQIRQWMNTGFHPAGKLLSLWNAEARAIDRGKVARAVEFGRRWFVTLLEGGYILGRPCQKLGSDTDAKISDEVLVQFLETFGEVPESYVYDRGGDGKKNHQFLEDIGVKNNCIFLKGKEKMEVTKREYKMAKRERALSEASIAVLKSGRYDFNRPRAKSAESCITKGQMAIMGANLSRMFRDVIRSTEMLEEI